MAGWDVHTHLIPPTVLAPAHRGEFGLSVDSGSLVVDGSRLPLRRLAENAGLDGSVVLENVRRTQKEKKSNVIGLDVMTGDYVDMVTAGIVDPAKVTRSAVENAASIAAMVLTTEAMITDKPEPEAAAPPMPPGGGMDF